MACSTTRTMPDPVQQQDDELMERCMTCGILCALQMTSDMQQHGVTHRMTPRTTSHALEDSTTCYCLALNPA